MVVFSLPAVVWAFRDTASKNVSHPHDGSSVTGRRGVGTQGIGDGGALSTAKRSNYGQATVIVAFYEWEAAIMNETTYIQGNQPMAK